MNNNKNIKELKRFNWGASAFTVIWGVCHKKYFTLLFTPLLFVPVVNIIVSVLFGIKGNEWAYDENMWSSPDEFNKYQEKWAIGYVVVAIACLIYLFKFSNFMDELKIQIEQTLEQLISAGLI